MARVIIIIIINLLTYLQCTSSYHEQSNIQHTLKMLYLTAFFYRRFTKRIITPNTLPDTAHKTDQK